MLIIISLGLLLIITLFNVILGTSWESYTFSSDFAVKVGIDEYMGALALILALVAVSAVSGVSCLGSGLADPSVRFVMLSVAYGSIWGILSVLAFNLIIAIEVFGAVIYVFLTILYTIGVIQRLAGGND